MQNRARTAAQHFYKSKRPRASYEQNHTFNGRQWQSQAQVPNMYVPTFVQPQLYWNPSWYNLPGPGTFAGPSTFKEQWRESSPQESSSSCFLNQQAPQYNSWKNTYRQHQEFQYPQTSMHRNFGSSSRSGAPRELVCYLCEGKGHYANECGSRNHLNTPFVEKIQNLEKVDYTQGFSSQNEEETLGKKEELVMGRLHSKAAICYWRNVIKLAPIVMEWLERKVPLFPRGVMNLAALPVPKPWSFTIEEREWINLELEHLRSTGAIELVGQGKERPEFLLEVSPVFVVPKQGPKKFRLVIDLRRLNKTLPKKSFKFEGLGTILRTIGKS